VEVLCLNAEATPGLQGQSGKERGHIMLVEPIEGAPQTVVIEHVRADPFSQQVLNRFVLKILRHQVELSIAEP
jgi:hypothetical protein